MTVAKIPTTEGGVFTFDDVPKYTRCYYYGVEGFILDKGANLSDATGRHLLIETEEEPREHHTTEITLHERLVDKYLNEKRCLWIDWGNRLSPYSD